MKKIIIGIIIGVIIGGGTVFGTNYLYQANEVSYIPEDSEFEVDNVEDAINELYDKNTFKEAVEVTTITTNCASYEMQNDGYVLGSFQNNSSNASAEIYYGDNNNYDIYVAEGTYNRSRKVSLYVTKGTTVRTRCSYGNYNLTVYEYK